MLPARLIAALDPMDIFPLAPTDAQILAGVDAWIEDLAAENYASAFARTAHDPYYRWTPELLRAVVEGYGLPEPSPDGRKWKVTDPHGCCVGKDIRRVERNIPGAFAHVSVQLPLNGEWSDLTAKFRVEELSEHSVLILEEIHVF
ncbi:MAG: hypothetical protein IPN20_05045 [Haliscomenobacter sp.]|nr:hypothetical protein [Haliscomenobacter sp.]